jgi:outer membrane protein
MSNKFFVALCGLLLSSALSAAELKVGVVQLQKLVSESAQVQKAQADMKRDFQARETKLVNEQNELKKLEGKLEKDAAVMSDAEKRKTEKELIERGREFKRGMEEMNQDLNIRRNQEMAKFQKAVNEAITAVAKEQNFDLVLVEGIAYAKEGLNITSDVEDKLKAAPGGAPASKK